MAHPGGAIRTNKAAALAKFLERKLQEPQGLASINPDLVELAVKKAKDSVISGDASSSARTVRHVDSFDDPEDSFDDEAAELKNLENVKKDKDKGKKRNKKKKKTLEKNKKNKNRKRKVEGKISAEKIPKKKLKS
ncbi:hypothetical protein SAY86_021631 [Trapa natans]|uniref:Uncharacterized protein n=1 Tax=Trapa natans TaxID=22666 RepID=A0AAN7M915_TRANT|nr:hypothetical protein SAY86_021631 [Trapa natans]